jgi:hypothetical protein
MEELAIWVVERDFGREVGSLASALCSKVSSTLMDLKKGCSLSLGDLRLYLLLLIKHNLVEISGSEESPLYSFSHEEAIHRLRFPRFLRQAEEKFDEICSSILLVLIREGRLTLQGCIEHIQDLCIQEGLEEVEREAYSPERIRMEMTRLLDGAFLIQISMGYGKELMRESEYTEVQGKLNGLGNKNGGPSKGSSLTRRRAVTPRSSMPNKKVMLAKGAKKEERKEEKKVETEKNNGEIFIEEESSSKGQTLFVNAKTGEEFFFKVNFRRFIHELRVEQVFNIFYKRMDSINAATLAQTILMNPPVLGKAANVRRSDSLTISKILECTPQLQSADEKSIERLLHQISQDP